MEIRTGKEGREKGGWGWLQLQGQDDKAECRRWDCTRLSECHICIHTYVYLGLSKDHLYFLLMVGTPGMRQGSPPTASPLLSDCDFAFAFPSDILEFYTDLAIW